MENIRSARATGCHRCPSLRTGRAAPGGTVRAFCGESRRAFARLFYHLRHRGVKPSTREFLTLLEALKEDVISPSIDDFYYLSKATLVKDETKFDRFDFAFRGILQGRVRLVDLKTAIPDEWLRKVVEKMLTPEERESSRRSTGMS